MSLIRYSFVIRIAIGLVADDQKPRVRTQRDEARVLHRNMYFGSLAGDQHVTFADDIAGFRRARRRARGNNARVTLDRDNRAGVVRRSLGLRLRGGHLSRRLCRGRRLRLRRETQQQHGKACSRQGARLTQHYVLQSDPPYHPSQHL